MKKKNLIWGGTVVGLMVGSFIAGTAIAKGPAAPKVPVLSSLADAKWMPLMKDVGALPALAPISGDPMKGGYVAYLKLPAGFVSPPHSHSGDYFGVVVQGKMTHWAVDGGSEKDAKTLMPGDLTFMPGKLDHVSKCFPGADCVVVLIQKSKFDFTPAKAPKAATPATPDKKPEAPVKVPQRVG